MKFLLGFVFALVLIFVGGWGYLKWGHLPVAAADLAFPFEAQIVHTPLRARIAREAEQPPFPGNEQVYEAGATIYAQNCAACHGVPGKDVAYAKWMYPRAPQLWKAHKRRNGASVTGVSDDEAAESYWKVKNGLRLTGMPAFEHVLSEEQMWDVTLLVKAADQPLSPQVKAILAGASAK